MKIYTKRGDDGSTGLFGGPRVGKDDARVAAYGDVDELNAVLGIARAEAGDDTVDGQLARVQAELFTLGSLLATPDPDDAPKSIPRLEDADISRLESEIDAHDTTLEPLRAFILPGGTKRAATLQLARTVCRRAERAVVALSRTEKVPAEVLRYLNRLSDWLFTVARVENARAGVAEPLWLPAPRR